MTDDNLDEILNKIKVSNLPEIETKDPVILQVETSRKFSSVPTAEIVAVEFGLMAETTGEGKDYAFSVLEITQRDNGVGDNSGQLYDPAGGPYDRRKICPTCKLGHADCAGHPFHIKLKSPIIHPLYIDHVYNILRSFCNVCAKPIIPESHYGTYNITKKIGKTKLVEIAKKADGVKSCQNKNCTENPIFTKKKNYITIGVGKSKKIQDVQKIYDIFQSIEDEDLVPLGLKKSNLLGTIVKFIVVNPPNNRVPPLGGSVRAKDKLTESYSRILKENLSVKDRNKKDALSARKKKGKEVVHTIGTYLDGMTEAFRVLIEGDKKKRFGSSGEPVGVKSLLGGKGGLVRANNMGKRVNWSARTVLGPNPELDFGEISVPRAFIKDLPHPVEVTAKNIASVVEWKDNDKLVYYIKSGDIIRRKRRGFEKYYPRIGDIVARHLKDGDVIVFNRQPTLSKHSLMSYTVRINDDEKIKTIRMHLAATSPHNADYDGDEGTLHAPQTLQAIKDAETVMHIKNNIMTGQSNGPILGVVMDGIIAWNLMTKYSKTLDDEDFHFVTNKYNITKAHVTKLWNNDINPMNSKAFLSYIVPDDFYFEKTDGSNIVAIKNGVLLSGFLTKSILNGNGSIIQALHADYGSEVTSKFLTDVYKLAYRYLEVFPVTVGYRDCILREGATEKIKTITDAAIGDVEKLNEVMISEESKIVLEDSSQARLNTVISQVSKVVQETAEPYNSFKIMTESGSKGSSFNITQITGVVGQQNIGGARPRRNMKVSRTLPQFKNNENSPESRGFVVRSFIGGLSPAEFFFHHAGGRDGLIDTSQKTAVSGLTHRNITKSIENVTLKPDGSVSSENGILSLSYGDDGFDPSKLERVNIGGTIKSFPVNLFRTIARLNYKYN